MAEPVGKLLQRVAERDADSVAELVRRFGPPARRLAVALVRDETLADDAVQEAFLSALGRLATLRSPESFGAWFRQIVRTEAGRQRRRAGNAATGDAGPEPPAREPGPPAVAESRETRRIVRDAVTRLPPAGRETVELFYFEGRSIPQVARELNVPAGTVKRRLHDARRRLADILIGTPGAWSKEGT